MSAVGGSGSSNRQDEVVRRNREEYQSKEGELVKKHHKEIRRLNEQHHTEIEKLKQAHADQMKSMQESVRKSVAQRDQRHQSDIDSMRTLHRKQLAAQYEDSARREESLQTMGQSEKDQGLLQMQSRLDKLNSDYESALREKENIFRQKLEENREAQSKGLADQRGRLEKAHAAELKQLKADRDQRIVQLKNDYSSYRKFSEGERGRLAIQGLENQKRSSDVMMNAVQKEQALRSQSEEELRLGFKEGLTKERERYESVLDKEREAQAAKTENLESDVRGRIGSRVMRLESENQQIKDERVRESARLMKMKDREVANVKDSFSKNIKNLERQKQDLVSANNSKNASEIHNITKKHERQMFDMTRNHLQTNETRNFEHKKDYEIFQTSLNTRMDQTQRRADRRIQNILNETETSKQRLTEMNMETNEALRRKHTDEIRSMRFQFEKEKNEAVERIRQQASQREVNHQEQVAQLKQNHQSEILSLKDEMLKSKRAAEEHLKRTVEELNRAHTLSLEQQEYKHKDKLQALEADHSNRLKNLNRRHDERLDQMSVAVRKKT